MTGFAQIMSTAKGWMMRHVPMMITCQELESFILDYLDDRLLRRQRIIFELHIMVCKECRSYLSAYRRTVALGKAAFDDPDATVREDMPEDLVRAIVYARTTRD